MLLAPFCALVAAAFAGEPLLAHWTQTFMGNAARWHQGKGGGPSLANYCLIDDITYALVAVQPRPRPGQDPQAVKL